MGNTEVTQVQLKCFRCNKEHHVPNEDKPKCPDCGRVLAYKSHCDCGKTFWSRFLVNKCRECDNKPVKKSCRMCRKEFWHGSVFKTEFCYDCEDKCVMCGVNERGEGRGVRLCGECQMNPKKCSGCTGTIVAPFTKEIFNGGNYCNGCRNFMAKHQDHQFYPGKSIMIKYKQRYETHDGCCSDGEESYIREETYMQSYPMSTQVTENDNNIEALKIYEIDDIDFDSHICGCSNIRTYNIVEGIPV